MTKPKIMVSVSRTSIYGEGVAEIIKLRLSKLSYVSRITFDLEDVDNVLRIDAFKNTSKEVIRNLRDIILCCEKLE
ncbi:MAG: hypothetical protein AAFZ15_31885 [Bacteroidota bacterium]